MTPNEKRDALADKHATEAFPIPWDNLGTHAVNQQNARDSFKAGWDAREPEIAKLKKEIAKYKNIVLKQEIEINNYETSMRCSKTHQDLQSQLTAAREEARALRVALKEIRDDECTNSYAVFIANAALATHAVREEQK